MKPAKPPKQPLISEEMKAWSTALAAETADWPNLSQRSFFGFTALYRGDHIFAMLPRSRNIDTANKIAFRIDAPSTVLQKRISSDERIIPFEVSKKKNPARWFTFLLSADADLHDALEWLSTSYQATARRKKK
jgi:hypothetical protein